MRSRRRAGSPRSETALRRRRRWARSPCSRARRGGLPGKIPRRSWCPGGSPSGRRSGARAPERASRRRPPRRVSSIPSPPSRGWRGRPEASLRRRPWNRRPASRRPRAASSCRRLREDGAPVPLPAPCGADRASGAKGGALQTVGRGSRSLAQTSLCSKNLRKRRHVLPSGPSWPGAPKRGRAKILEQTRPRWRVRPCRR